MDIGIFTGITDEQIRPAPLARAVEERGFESLFVAEHTHIPARRDTPYPDGAEIPRDYYRNLDPFVSLAAAAAVTTRLRLGTAVALVAQRDPILLAKEAASLDLISDGRFELGVGAGWLREEMLNHGTSPATRVPLLRERLAAAKAIWTTEQAEFHGRFVDFDPIFQWPKPVQRPHPPVWIGGWGPTTFDRIVADGDGWLAPGIAVDLLTRGVTELAEVADRAGVPAPPVIATLADPDEATIEKVAALGVRRILFSLLPVTDAETTMRALDRLGTLARRADPAWFQPSSGPVPVRPRG
ncbi:N5,N10-methylene tetrahydromethanopterin reductase [Frankia sp. R43]|uniref:LLM class F420-dependent oxidoreductase n=1 Tax=Frankia sp. R43 TaxID=269536 RepID=UPI0006C9F2B5|nr:LLM class F420-dependent oxidoreductase [Frankia sp. R43]KPM53746.1 N5,N10-methylene tetrahydromethanopterin reductase [Frankia sp. R43]